MIITAFPSFPFSAFRETRDAFLYKVIYEMRHKSRVTQLSLQKDFSKAHSRRSRRASNKSKLLMFSLSFFHVKSS